MQDNMLKIKHLPQLRREVATSRRETRFNRSKGGDRWKAGTLYPLNVREINPLFRLAQFGFDSGRVYGFRREGEGFAPGGNCLCLLAELLEEIAQVLLNCGRS